MNCCIVLSIVLLSCMNSKDEFSAGNSKFLVNVHGCFVCVCFFFKKKDNSVTCLLSIQNKILSSLAVFSQTQRERGRERESTLL